MRERAREPKKETVGEKKNYAEEDSECWCGPVLKHVSV